MFGDAEPPSSISATALIRCFSVNSDFSSSLSSLYKPEAGRPSGGSPGHGGHRPTSLRLAESLESKQEWTTPL